jgi:hypothetical protein
MRIGTTLPLLVASIMSAGYSVPAQSQGPLAGAWERVSMKDSTGANVQSLPPAAFTIFSSNGYYTQIAIPSGRPKVEKPLTDYTKEELLARFNRAEARRGRYTVSGNTLTRTYVATLNPSDEGRDPQVQRFRIEGDVLILTSTTAGNRSEVRFHRVR